MPLIHHYSWVRPQTECLQKASTWSHRYDEDWSQVIQEAFSSHQGKKLFGTDLHFQPIGQEPYFDPLQVSIPKDSLAIPMLFPHVEKLTPEKVFRRQLEKTFR